MKKIRWIIFTMVFLGLFFVLAGCSSQANEDEKIAYISSHVNSDYEKMFKKMGLGILFDYHLKLPSANQSWVTIWVEGYRNGAAEPVRITEISYGLSPNQVEEGLVGFGIINPNSDHPLFLLYSPTASVSPHPVEGKILDPNATISTWDYAIGKEAIGLEAGETKILAVYRQAENSLKTYDYQDLKSINQILDESLTVLLLKIKVDEKYE